MSITLVDWQLTVSGIWTPLTAYSHSVVDFSIGRGGYWWPMSTAQQ